MKRLVLLFLLSFCVGRSATYYVTQSGAGTHAGTSLGNAWSVSDLNAPSTYTGGDTVRLEGTISSQVTVQHGGSAGNVVTILFGTGAKLSTAAWGASGAIVVYANLSYVTIDGGGTGTLGGPTGSAAGTNGIIECTDNGTNLTNHVPCKGIYTVSAKHFTVQNLVIQNLYVRVAGTDENISNTPSSVSGVYVDDSDGNGVNNLLFNNLIIHDTQCGLYTDYGAGDNNYTASNVTVYNSNWGGGTADRGVGSTMTGLLVFNCLFYNFTNWNDTAIGNAYHHNGWYGYATNGLMTNPIFHHNKVGPGFDGTYSTSAFFLSENIAGAQYYDNIFVAGSGEGISNAYIKIGISNTSSGVFRIYNNTVDDHLGSGSRAFEVGGSPATIVADIKNNIIWGNSAGSAVAIVNSFSNLTTLTSDYNVIFNYGSSPFIYDTAGGSTTVSLATWQSHGYDPIPHSSTSTPNLDGNYFPVSTSSAIGTGFDQSTYFTTDYSGTAWAGGTGWGIGANKAAGAGSTGGSSFSGKITISGKVTIQ